MPHATLKPLLYKGDWVEGAVAKRQVRKAIWLAGPPCNRARRHAEHFGKRVAVNVVLQRVRMGHRSPSWSVKGMTNPVPAESQRPHRSEMESPI